MRALILLALVAVTACGRGDRAAAPDGGDTAAALADRGPDPLMLRVPTRGGVARVVSYPGLDSTLWESTTASPAIDRVLTFDDDEGMIAFVDQRGRPGRIDLRGQTVTSASQQRLVGLASVNAATIYGVDAAGDLRRYTPDGDWRFDARDSVRRVVPLRNGEVIVLSGSSPAMAWRLHPPADAVVDSLSLPPTTRAVVSPVGDRIFLQTRDGLMSLHTRRFVVEELVPLDAPVSAMAVTPSGDRVYLAVENAAELQVVDPYRRRVARTIELPSPARDLRIDPLGRYLIARAARGDSVWIVSIGSEQVVSRAASAWRGDLPMVAPDGAIAIVTGADVVFLDAESGQRRRTVAGGASDFWYAFWWNGFRPLSAVAELPVEIVASADTMTVDTLPPPAVDTAPPPPVEAGPPPAPVFFVQFHALLSEQRAQDVAAGIEVNGEVPRVMTTLLDGVPVYRVVLGPYDSRAAAEAVGVASRRAYLVREGPR